MRNRLFLWIMIIILSFSLIGCQKKPNQPTEKPSDESVPAPTDQSVAEAIDNIIIQPTQIDPRENGIKTKLSDFAFDLDGDGSEEKIELYTAAGRDENGNMIWDDGQNWLLLIEDGDEYYPLLQEYVQLGVVYFTVWLEENIPEVTVIVNTGANLNVVSYTYDSQQGVYKGETIYDKVGINGMFSSIPSY